MLRTARTLVFYPHATHGLVAHNYLQNKKFGCNVDTLRFMMSLQDWRKTGEIATTLGVPNDDTLSIKLSNLVSVGCLIEQSSEAESRERQHHDEWRWGVPTALYHASLVDRPIVSVEEALQYQRDKLRNDHTAPATIFDELRFYDIERVQLPDVELDASLQETINRRRTMRDAGAAPVTLSELAACLNNALGVQAIETNEAGAPIVFKPTPSGGAKNPFDAFVLNRRIDGLAEGIWAYDPHERALLQTGHSVPDFGEFLNGQDWPENMDALIVLQANFQRTMWKYDDANAYRVVLIEAGHIGQNIMLAATACGLSACPSAAINVSLAADELFNCDPIMSPPIYALGLVRPRPGH